MSSRPENFDPNADYPVEFTIPELVVLHLILRRAHGDPERSMMKHVNNILPRVEATLFEAGILTKNPDDTYLYNGEDLDQYITGDIPLHDVPPDLEWLLE